MKTYEYLQARIAEESAVSSMDDLGRDGWKLVTITEYHPEEKNGEGKVIESRSALYTFMKRRPKQPRTLSRGRMLPKGEECLLRWFGGPGPTVLELAYVATMGARRSELAGLFEKGLLALGKPPPDGGWHATVSVHDRKTKRPRVVFLTLAGRAWLDDHPLPPKSVGPDHP